MTDHVESFSEYRPLLFSIAYRMLGSVMESEDILQEAFLRWEHADLSAIESPKAYLSAIVTRLCLDHLKSAKVQRELYIGTWLPEPLMTDPSDTPANALALSESISMAFLVLLESLSPDERAVFLLREVFDYPYIEIAGMLEKSETACRQLFTRARQRISEGRPRFEVTREEQEQVTMQFVQACMTGSIDSLVQILAPSVISYSDGGGVVSAARRPILGPERVARLILGLMKKAPPNIVTRYMRINDQPAFVYYRDGQATNVMVLDIGDGKVQALRNVVNPEKLQHIPPLED